MPPVGLRPPIPGTNRIVRLKVRNLPAGRPILRPTRTVQGLFWLLPVGWSRLLGAGISVGELNYNDPEGADFDFH